MQTWILAGFFVVACALPGFCNARELPTTVVGGDAELSQRIARAAGHAVLMLSGPGDRIAFHVRAVQPMEVLVFFDRGPALDITTALAAEVPAGTDNDVTIDVSASPAWIPFTNHYRVFVLSQVSTGNAISTFTLLPTPLWRIPVVAWNQFWAPATYSPSSYHRLKGPQVFSVPFALIVLAAVLLCLGWVLWRQRRDAWLRHASIILLSAILIASARSTVDLLRFTAVHLQEWYGTSTYELAGSTYTIATFIRDDAAQKNSAHPSVLLCHEGNTYLPALLTYLLFPIPVTEKGEGNVLPRYIVADEARDGSVSCAGRQFKGLTPLQTFADGSAVFAPALR